MIRMSVRISCLTALCLAIFLCGPLAGKAEAQEGFLGEIRLWAGSRIPENWALCDGSMLNISQYIDLFGVMGTAYGGDGRTIFALPDLRGRVPVHPGQGNGLTSRTRSTKFGSETTLIHTGASEGQQTNIVEKRPDDNGYSLTSVAPVSVLRYIICITGVAPQM